MQREAIKSTNQKINKTKTELTMSKTASEGVLYDDGFVTLTDNSLILKVYYFPFATSKTIPLEDIDRIWVGTDPALGLEHWWKRKTWGMPFSNVFWALHSGREFSSASNNEYNFVVSFKSWSMTRSGFSVENPKAFRELAKKYIHD